MPGPFDGDASAPPAASARDELDFVVLSQRVDLDVDFLNKSINGTTDITAQPLSKTLKSFRLHCRQCRILSVTVQKRPANFVHVDPYHKLNLWEGRATVRQHEFLRSRIDKSIGQSPAPDLTISLPPRVTVRELEPDAFSIPSKADDPTRRDSDMPETPTIPTAVEPTDGYATMNIRITFEVSDFKDGLHFVGFDAADGRYPHLYTKNMSFPGTSSALFPCLDTCTARSMWEISIRCPKTLGDAFRLDRPTPENLDSIEPAYATSLSDHDKALDLNVICSGDMTDDITDPADDTKRTISFACTTPVTARHVAVAIGPFETVDLSAEFRQSDEDDKLGQSAIKVLAYCLPGRADEVRNTCLTLSMAIDYFTVTFGSFPFSSYQVCFVDDLKTDVTDAAGLSICSNRLLFKEDLIDPLDGNTRAVIRGLACQYSGINVIAKEPSDIWVTTGIAGYMTDIFMKKVAGNNEYRFAQKLATETVHATDIDRYSIHQLGGQLDIDPSELDFLRLKSALVLFILDRRLTKVSGSAGMSRIVTRLLLHAKTGNLVNSEVTTDYFMRLCEKLGHTKLDAFFRQWVYGAGCPDFRVSQSFNKKKLVVDMIFEQTQSKRIEKPRLHSSTFLREAKEQVAEAWVPAIQPVFTGPMTIRIHEADGTPYEHIVEIRDLVTRIEIPYNTKYKRLKRSKRNKDRATNDTNAADEHADDALLHCLGDTLQSDSDMADWKLVDWDTQIETEMGQESYEWIRLDADFEWIANFNFRMKPYMYVSQLQQDRDVVAQYESLQNIIINDPHPMMSTILVRTLMDSRYFHGIRTFAARGLAKCAASTIEYRGLFHLEKAFNEQFCLASSSIPRPNDFADRASYLVKCAIIKAIALVRDDKGSAPLHVRRFLLDKLKLNDNSTNIYSDNVYIATLLTCLCQAIAVSVQPINDHNPGTIDFEEDEVIPDPAEEQVKAEALAELDRYRRMDEWISSYHNTFSTAAITCLTSLLSAKAVDFNSGLFDILQYTRPGNADAVRQHALEAIVELKAARKPQMLKYILYSLADDPSPRVRASLLSVLGQALGSIAIGDDKPVVKPVVTSMEVDTGLVLEQVVQAPVSQDDDEERKTSPAVALDLLKDSLKNIGLLQKATWRAVCTPSLSLNEAAELLDVAGLLFDSTTMADSLIWVKPLPRKYRVRHMGNGLLNFCQTDVVRWKPSKYAPMTLVDFKRVQASGLKYTGPITKEARSEQKALEPVKLKLGLGLGLGGAKPAAAATAPSSMVAVPNTSMAAPPVPAHTTPFTARSEGLVKFSLKRKESVDGAKLSSPKPAKAPKTNPPPSPLALSRTPSEHGARAVPSASSTPAPAMVSSRIVRLKMPGLGDKIAAIQTGKPPRKGLVLKVKHVSRPTTAAGEPHHDIVDQSSLLPSVDDGLFSNVNAMQAGWNMGGFRDFPGGSHIDGSGSSSQRRSLDIPSALPSGISPRTTVWPTGRPGSTGSSDSLLGGTRPMSAPQAASEGVAGAAQHEPMATLVKDESSDEEPLMKSQTKPIVSGKSQPVPVPVLAPMPVSVPVAASAPVSAPRDSSPPAPPKRPGMLKLKLGKRP